jgi:PTH1 family peptidyl-tRNA hydrolase
MGYMVRNNLINEVPQTYTISSMNKPALIVGLGNPGPEYVKNRHNIGFMALDRLAESQDVSFVTKKDLKALVAVSHLDGRQVVLAKPQTFMNLSGEAVQSVMKFYNVNISDVTVVHDELDLPFGTVKKKIGGGSAGHNGLKSIIQHIGEDFARIRIGIGPKTPDQMDTADFVLQDFSKEEQKKLPKIIEEAMSNL